MPTYTRAQASGLPDIDEAVVTPFANLVIGGTGFDARTIESTAQHAHSSIFIGPNGQRFRLEKLPDIGEQQQQQQQQQPQFGASNMSTILSPLSPTAGASAQLPGGQPAYLQHHHSLSHHSLSQEVHRLNHRSLQRRPVSTASTMAPMSPAHQGPSQPDGYGGYAPPAQQQQQYHYPPAQHAASQGQYSRQITASPPTVGTASGVEPKVPTQHVATYMPDLGGVPRFGADPLYIQSDGGVQAATTLTDSVPQQYQAQGYPQRQQTQQECQQQQLQQQLQQQPYPITTATGITYSHPFIQQYSQVYNLPHNTDPQPQHQSAHMQSMQQVQQQQQQQQQPSIPPGMMLVPIASPPIGHPNMRPQHRASLGVSSSASGSSVPSLVELPTPLSARGSMNFGQIQLQPLAGPVVPPRTSSGQHARGLIPLSSTPADGHDEKIVNMSPEPMPMPSPPQVIVNVQAPSTMSPSDSGSTHRDGVLPGEDLVFEGNVRYSHLFQGPFEDGRLWVFRNTLTNDLRFYCRAGNNSETCWAKGATAQLVPQYAYDQRSEMIVYVRDNETEVPASSTSVPAAAITRPNGIYQFLELADLFRFQARLTGEDVIFDIAAVRWIKLAKLNGRTIETHSAARLQIWHEPRVRARNGPGGASDRASIVTAGTALSGPQRDKVVPNTSRLMIFLGRAEIYMMVFITDHVELKADKQTCVKLRPRRPGGVMQFSRARPGVKAHLENRKGSEPAGLTIDGQALNTDLEESFDTYKTFEIEFETENGQTNFIAAWNDVMEVRRKQLKKLEKIQEEMAKETYSASTALAIKT